MNLLEAILNGQGAPVQQIASKFGLGEAQVQEVISKFLPALTNGMKREISSGNLDGLMNAIRNGGHDHYLENPNAITSSAAVSDGNSILGHLLGGKDVSRELASRTAQQIGLDSGILKQMLPMIAGLAMGAMKKQGANQGLLELSGSSSAASLGPLMKLLDADGDGSVIDDLLGLASRFLR